ncbi:hypothetical protein BAE44_0002104 [Dichanthelium oligosanthes]|uniref:Uncharacterized protein n=1 Tax=Dichanthelium oligosanthes TaxID=888268 RepID=A0A1E5WHK2_9POAL|nr:hypothetical protein BAE44_0002104 [Dichanthelium oligosanthes]
MASSAGPAAVDNVNGVPALARHCRYCTHRASSAVTAVSGEAGPVLCFGMHALLLLGLSLINIGVLGD